VGSGVAAGLLPNNIATGGQPDALLATEIWVNICSNVEMLYRFNTFVLPL